MMSISPLWLIQASLKGDVMEFAKICFPESPGGGISQCIWRQCDSHQDHQSCVSMSDTSRCSDVSALSIESYGLQFVIKYEIVDCTCKRYFQLWLNCHEWHLLPLCPAVCYSETFPFETPFETTTSFLCPLLLIWSHLSFSPPFAHGISTTRSWLQSSWHYYSFSQYTNGLFTLKMTIIDCCSSPV